MGSDGEAAPTPDIAAVAVFVTVVCGSPRTPAIRLVTVTLGVARTALGEPLVKVPEAKS